MSETLDAQPSDPFGRGRASAPGRRSALPWFLVAGLSALLVVAAVAWARAVLARQDLAFRLAIEGKQLRREADALRQERDAAAAAHRAIDARLARGGYRAVAVRQALERGRALAESGRVAEGLLWMARAVAYAPADDAGLQRVIRTNLDAWPAWMARLDSEHAFPEPSVLRPDGLVIAAPAPGGPIRLLNVADGKPSGPELPNAGLPVVFAQNGSRLLVRHPEDRSLQVWDLARGSPVGPPFAIVGNRSIMPALSPDGSLVAIGVSSSELRLVRAATGTDACPPITGLKELTFAGFEPSGKRLLVIGDSGRRFDVPGGKPSGGFYSEHSRILGRERIVFGPEGRYLGRLHHHWVFSTADSTGREHRRSFLPRSRIDLVDLAISHDGHRIVSADGAGWIQVWDEASGAEDAPPFRVQVLHGRLATYFEPDDRVLVVWQGSHAQRWRLPDRLTVGPQTPPLRAIPRPPRVRQSADGSRVAEVEAGKGADYDRIVLRPARGGGPTVELARRHSSLLATSRDGSLLAIRDGSRSPSVVRVFRFSDGSTVGEPLPHEQGVLCAAVSPDGSRVATGDSLDMLRVWDLRSGRLVGPAIRKADDILAVDYNHDGTLLLVGDESGEARLHDASDGTQIGGPMTVRSLGTYTLPVSVIVAAFAPDGHTFQVAGPSSERWNRRVPVPVGGDAEQVALWASALTGLELDAADQAVPLDPERWRKLRQRVGPGPAPAGQQAESENQN